MIVQICEREMTSPADLIASVVEALKDPSVRAGLLEAVVKPAVEAAVRRPSLLTTRRWRG